MGKAEGKEMDVKVVLLDIEGTVCSISFVKDVLYPYALTTLETLLPTHWTSPSFTPYLNAFPAAHRTTPTTFLTHIRTLTSTDSKLPHFKNLQSHLWHQGYLSGDLLCPLYPDVPPSLTKWHTHQIRIYIYSSGSISAQKLLFQHTDSNPSDLTPLISGYHDTVTAGTKREKRSYENIFQKEGKGEEVGEWLFLSDRTEEVDAAREAGMQAVVVVREGNAPLSKSEQETYHQIHSFAERELT